MSFHTLSDPPGRVLGLNIFAQFGPLSEGLFGIELDFPERSWSLNISTLPPWAPVADRIFCKSSIASFYCSLSLIVHTKIKCKCNIFSTIRFNACNVQIWTLSSGIGKIGFQRFKARAPISGLACTLVENRPPDHD